MHGQSAESGNTAKDGGKETGETGSDIQIS